ncbi:hypothetical protein LPJ78_003384 [Coemansia sp. RSA 989]|nr:hypothetical protein LPJ68_003549 [Coemansia sp. RSA 1086]KAJ1749265.1 hypothetical protein LPJ79_003865 [Coemansia sp. RSA 1821]KAJ1864430.1 hypothetical protein LPJ78_003384 [Coemansia sp. RSA 989]KAJ1871120.1 hypothetical protein LPJ55_004139 [Coemansia sp. RSA 990]KAJ2668964.1 hypothetical protein IWW42_004890 [Coemansia sp. RSA 1085]
MSGKKTTELRAQSQFFAGPAAAPRRPFSGTGCTAPSPAGAGSMDSVSIRDVLQSRLAEKRRAAEEAKARGDDDWDSSQFVQLDQQTSNHVKSLIQQSDAIQRVRKERIFEDEVTEEEMEIIKQRVALQQQQFAEFERREFAHKAQRIRQMYRYLDDEEIREALKEGSNDVDETIYRFSTAGYLLKLRKAIAQRHTPLTVTPQMTDVQRAKYEEMLKKRTRVQKKTTTSDARDKYRTVGRLPLDEALAQLQRAAAAKSGAGIDLSRAMKGWSEARIKAFKAIKTKPNTYYYRFNAPGEEQRTGQWTPEEQRLFHARLKEIGANGQWGIFSMTIPGRVGYQCSNYYRYLVENRLIHDPNYVLDPQGKARYLFTSKKKNPDGSAVRVFRKHRKPHVRMSREKYGYSDSDSDADSPASSSKAPSLSADAMSAAIAAAAEAEPADIPPKPAEPSAAPAPARRPAPRAATSARKRKRRGHYGASSSDDDVIRANEVELSGGDSDTSDGDYHVSAASRRRCTRRRNAGSVCGSSSGVDGYAAAAESHAASDNESGLESDSSPADPSNPLPDLIDPITLEPVAKPAISPYGHVMGYNTWVRCLLFPPEGSQRNVCPLTKKPLSKRDLVVLTLDNIDQYRDKIVNL